MQNRLNSICTATCVAVFILLDPLQSPAQVDPRKAEVLERWKSVFGPVDFSPDNLFEVMLFAGVQPDSRFKDMGGSALDNFSDNRMQGWREFILRDDIFKNVRASQYYLGKKDIEPDLLRYEWAVAGTRFRMLESVECLTISIQPAGFDPKQGISSAELVSLLKSTLKLDDVASDDLVKKYKLPDRLKIGDLFSNGNEMIAQSNGHWRDRLVGFIGQDAICVICFKTDGNEQCLPEWHPNWLATHLLDAAAMKALEDAKSTPFQREMAAATKAVDRDERILHLKNATDLRPGDPLNIQLEFQIGNILCFNANAARGERTQPARALKIFEGILANYEHQKYYRSELPYENDTPQTILPRTEIQVASILQYTAMLTGEAPKKDEVRAHLEKAMEELLWTYEHRKADWAGAPKPGGLLVADSSNPRMVKHWEARRAAAASGDPQLLLGKTVLDLIDTAVRMYGDCIGDGKLERVPTAMDDLSRKFSGTIVEAAAKKESERVEKIQSDKANVLQP